MNIHRISAFSDTGRGGNPAGVVVLDAFPDEDEMHRVAAEVGYSETAFAVTTSDLRRLRVRYFSPEIEVAFCGHATIATALVLAENHGPGVFEFETLAGSVLVETTVSDKEAVASLTSVVPRVDPVPAGLLEALLPSFHWAAPDLDEALPAALAYAGAWHLVLGLKELATLAAMAYDVGAVGSIMADHGLTTVQCVHRTGPFEFRSRNPFPVGGIVEDPATGAAAAALGAYLRHHELIACPGQITVRQDLEMGAPSLLRVDIPAGSSGIRVSGSGHRLDAGSAR